MRVSTSVVVGSSHHEELGSFRIFARKIDASPGVFAMYSALMSGPRALLTVSLSKWLYATS